MTVGAVRNGVTALVTPSAPRPPWQLYGQLLREHGWAPAANTLHEHLQLQQAQVVTERSVTLLSLLLRIPGSSRAEDAWPCCDGIQACIFTSVWAARSAVRY